MAGPWSFIQIVSWLWVRRFPNARVIDVGGGTILPGLIDAHLHTAADLGVRRQLLTGRVTAICDLGSPLSSMPRFDHNRVEQDPVARGYRAGPILTELGCLPDAILHEDLNHTVATPLIIYLLLQTRLERATVCSVNQPV